MALIKEPYGLVYNDDGSLCTTYRDDDVPFAGVRSFAVETATTNYFGIDAWEFDADQSTFYPYELASGKTWADCWDTKQRAYVGGHNITVWRIWSQIVDLGQVYSAGTKITLSWKHKGYLWFIIFYYGLTTDSLTYFNSTNTYEIKGDASLDHWESNIGLHLKINNIRTGYFWNGSPQHLLDRWYDVEITYTLPANTRYIQIIWDFYNAYLADGGRGVKGYIHKPQIEVKPFASSFVVGSRPTGIIAVPFYIDLNTEDWVVSFWHKMTNTYSFASRIIFSIDGNFHLNTYHPSAGKYNWMCMNTDNVVFKASSTTTVDTNWNFIVLTKNGSNFKVYINGIPEINLNYTGTLKYNVNNFKFGNFGFGGIGQLSYVSNSLFSNIYIGKYRRKDGTVIWTDDYIREVYEAQMPFAVQNQLSIY